MSGRVRFPEIYNALSDEEKAQRESDAKKLLAAFMALILSISRDSEVEAALYELMRLRSEIAVSYLLKGLGISRDDALMLIKNIDDNSLTRFDIELRDRLVAGIRNLVDFSVAAEYQAYLSIPERIDMDDQEMLSEYEELSNRYHLTYAGVEHGDVEYAASVALKWITAYSAGTTLMYLTMNDDRVRPWHRALEGFSAPRDMFPAWMIPPIEWGCRCYLVDVSGDVVENRLKVSAKAPAKPLQIDNVFSESLAKCGRIFGKSHPYFRVRKEHAAKLMEYSERIIREDYAKEILLVEQ